MQWRLALPILSGFGLSLICPVSGGTRLPQTPPSYMFPIIWCILYILIGVSWQRAAISGQALCDVLHGVLVAFLLLWMLVYACGKQKKAGMYVLAGIFALTICCMSLHTDLTSKVMLAPMVAWILVAFHLNYHLIEQSPQL